MIDWGLLLAALITVESGGDTKAVGDNGRAVGCLQIHAIYVDDCNEINGRKKQAGKGKPYSYTLQDRKFESTSRGMAIAYLRHYGARYKKKTGKEPSYEALARIHNGGPDGYSKTATDDYWRKVRAALDSIRKKEKLK